jgi:hypothetical protein
VRHFLSFDVNDRWVDSGRKQDEVDILVRKHRLIIEFDGEYFHRDRERLRRDRIKTRRLLDAGWKVIRVREEPLKLVGPYDVKKPETTGTKECANLVLLKVAEVLGLELPGLAEYLAQPLLMRKAEAEAHLDQLRRDRTYGLDRRRALLQAPQP